MQKVGVTLKVDIAKVFYNLSWSFMLKVLQKFGFNSNFWHWINTIFHSICLHISINGALHDFFKCARGVRLGDPFPPYYSVWRKMFSIEVFRSWFLQVIFIWLQVLKKSNFLITLSRKTTFLSSVSVRLQTVWVFTSIFITYSLTSHQFISREKSSIHSR